MTIRVLIADDQSMVRAGFRMLLSGEPGIEVAAEARDGLEAVAKAARFKPNVILMDIRMPVPRPAPPKELDELTAREHDILLLIARGLSNSEIGRQLYISETTVKTHVTHILQKLGLRDRVQAVVLAYQAGLFEKRADAQ